MAIKTMITRGAGLYWCCCGLCHAFKLFDENKSQDLYSSLEKAKKTN